MQIPVKPAFALALYGGFLTHLSRPLGALVTFWRAWRPTQTAYLRVSPLRGERYQPERAVFHRPLGTHLAARPGNESRLRYTFGLSTTTAGCSKAPRGLRFQTEDIGLLANESVSPASERGQ